MRGIYTSVIDIRRKVFTEVARLAYESGDYAKKIEQLPFKILPGELASYRESIFLERAIIGERLRLAIGLPVRTAAESAPVSDGIEESAIARKYYDPPLINIIKFACHACPENKVVSTNACQGCLAHPCTEVCPKDAIHIINGRSVIDQEKCIQCGRCIDVCPYNAIIHQKRPCAAACGIDAISSDQYGRAKIDYDKCVSCGMCLVNCPFGAIVDKGQIFQMIHAMKEGHRVYAAVAPAFVGQFGPKVTPGKLRAAMKALGFADVIEVAVGADLCATDEAKDFMENVPDKLPFMATSCCPAWSVMAKKLFPEFKDCVSMTLTPMVLTGRLIKLKDPKDINATPKDITSNPKNLKFKELEAAVVPTVIKDVDIAALNGNYAIQADLKVADALAIESAEGTAGTAYVNVLAVKEGRESDPAIQALAKALCSDEVQAFIDETYAGAVQAVF